MVAWPHMREPSHIMRTWEQRRSILRVVRIERAGEHEDFTRHLCRRRKEKLFNFLLTVRCVSSHVAERAVIRLWNLNALMNVRINGTIKGHSMSCAPSPLEFAQDFAASEGKVEIEFRDLVRT